MAEIENAKLDQTNVDNVFGDTQPMDAVRNLKGIELLIDKATAFHVKMPMLEIIYDRLVRVFASTLRNFSSSNADVEVEKVAPARFGDFTEMISIPTIIAVVKSVEWDNYVLVVLDSSLTYSFVDILFGGRKNNSDNKVEGRPFTSIEQAISQTVIELLLNDLETCFEQVTPVTFQLDRLESNPRFATIARPEDVGMLATINIGLEGRTGKLEIYAPFATLEPVKKILAKSFIGEKGNKDPTWIRHFQQEIPLAKVSLNAFLTGRTSTIKEAINLKVGDTLVLDTLASDDIILRVGDLPVSSGKLGKMDDKIAVRLSEGLAIKSTEG